MKKEKYSRRVGMYKPVRPWIFCDKAVNDVRYHGKCQFRKPLEIQPYRVWGSKSDIQTAVDNSPFVRPGSKLYVQEYTQFTYEQFIPDTRYRVKLEKSRHPELTGCIVYMADGEQVISPKPYRTCRRSAAYMLPQVHSRIMLEVTDVSIQRVCDITEADMKDECTPNFEEVWELKYGGGSFKKNPWVWAVKFKMIEDKSKGWVLNG